MARTDHVLSQVAIAPDDQAAANQDDFDTARVAGNARTHTRPAPYRPLWWPRRILGESGAVKPRLRRCAALVGQWVAVSQLDTADRMERAAAMWAAANRDDFDTARVAGNARTHGPHRPRTSRCGGLAASSGSRGSETTLWRCAGGAGQWGCNQRNRA